MAVWIRSHRRRVLIVVVLTIVVAGASTLVLSASGGHGPSYGDGFTYGEYQYPTASSTVVCDGLLAPPLNTEIRHLNEGQFRQGCVDGYDAAMGAVGDVTSPLPAGLALPYNRLDGLCPTPARVSAVAGEMVQRPLFTPQNVLSGTSPKFGGVCRYELASRRSVEIAFAPDPPTTETVCAQGATTTGSTSPQHCTYSRYVSTYSWLRHQVDSSNQPVTAVAALGRAAFVYPNELIVELPPELLGISGPVSVKALVGVARLVLPGLRRMLEQAGAAV